MAVRFHCPHCQGLLSISSRRIGAVVPCPTCNRDVLVPDRDILEPPPSVAVFAPLVESAAPKAPRAPVAPPSKQPDFEAPFRFVEDAERADVAASAPPRDLSVPSLEVRFVDGQRRDLPLSRTAPVTIGSQSFNDVCIADNGVAPLYCRIGFNKIGFEVTAATPHGVELNGTVVEHAMLNPGDALRIGAADVVYWGEPPQEAAPDSRQKPKPEGAGPAPPPPLPKAKPAPREPSLFEGPVLMESSADISGEFVEVVDTPSAAAPLRRLPAAEPEDKPVVAEPASPVVEKVRLRPGEQEVLRSPLILGLSVAACVLLLVALTLWMLMGREQKSRLLEQAETELAEGKYAQAVERFEEFLKRYPTSRMSRTALIGVGKARVQKEISGATPSWELAWQRLDELVQLHRNTADYRDLQPIVRDYSEQIAIGAAIDAEATKTESLLEISGKASNLMEKSADPDTPQTGPLEIIRTATERAHVAIRKQSLLDETVSKMQAALTENQPITALSLRAGLLRQFPEFAKEGRIRAALQTALTKEQGQIAVEQIDRAALTDDRPATPSVLPVIHARSRSDEVSEGKVVFVMAQDSVFAVDDKTGELVWRRVVGRDVPFFPMPVRDDSGMLLFDARHNELVMCRADTGRVQWRQRLDNRPLPAPPCIDGGQIYLAMEGGQLERLSLETGQLTARLKFSQELAGAPVVSPDKAHLFVAGERGLIYTLRRYSLEFAALTFTDHAPRTVRAPLLTLGRMLLVCENDRGDSAQLRLWDASQPDSALAEVLPSQRVAGSIYDVPVLRGSHLVASSSQERLAAFAVDDEPGRMGLAPIGEYRLQDGYGGPQYVMLGPDQQFWVSSTAFRRFEIGSESLRMDTNAVAVGLTAQPLQAIGETFFVARRSFFGEAVVFTNIDRERMVGTWRLTVGARPREVQVGVSGGVTLVTESGVVFRIGATRLNQGGVELRGGAELEIPADLRSAPWVARMTDGRVAVAVGGDAPKLWFVDTEGRVSAGPAIERPAECPPVLLDDGLLWPSAGRLQLKPMTSSAQRFEEWRASAGNTDTPAWSRLVRTGGREFFSFQQDGTVRQFLVETENVPHLREVEAVNMSLAHAIAPVLLGDEIALVTDAGSLEWLKVRSFHIAKGPTFNGAIRTIWPAGDRLLVQLADGTASLVSREPVPKIDWSTPLGNVRLTGTPHLTETVLWLAGSHGELLALDRNSGEVRQRKQSPQELSVGVCEIGGALWVVAVDGTLYRVADLPDVQQHHEVQP